MTGRIRVTRDVGPTTTASELVGQGVRYPLVTVSLWRSGSRSSDLVTGDGTDRYELTHNKIIRPRPHSLRPTAGRPAAAYLSSSAILLRPRRVTGVNRFAFFSAPRRIRAPTSGETFRRKRRCPSKFSEKKK